jgi:hypothetical protein
MPVTTPTWIIAEIAAILKPLMGFVLPATQNCHPQKHVGAELC